MRNLFISSLLFTTTLLGSKLTATDYLRLDFSRGLQPAVGQAKQFGADESVVLRKIDGKRLAKVPSGQTLGYGLNDVKIPLDAGELLLSVRAITKPVGGKNDQMVFLMGNKSTGGFLSIAYLESRQCFMANVQPPGKSGKRKKMAIEQSLAAGDQVKMRFTWQAGEGDTLNCSFQIGKKRSDLTLKANDLPLAKFSSLRVGCTPWENNNGSGPFAFEGVTLSDLVAAKPAELPTATETLAVTTIPEGRTTPIQDDHDPRLALDGSLATCWWQPSRGKNTPDTRIDIDLGSKQTIGSFRIAATFGQAYQNPYLKQADGSFAKREFPYTLQVSSDGKTWKTAYKTPAGKVLPMGVKNRITLNQPQQARYLRLSTRHGVGFCLVADIEFFDANGQSIHSFANLRRVNNMLTQLRTIRDDLSYVTRSGAWLAKHHDLKVDESKIANAATEITAIETRLRGLREAPSGALDKIQASVNGLRSRLDAALTRSDNTIDTVLGPQLLVDAERKLRLLSKDEQAKVLFERLKQANDPDARRQGLEAFNRHYRGRFRELGLLVKRDGRRLLTPDGRPLVPFGVNYNFRLCFDPALRSDTEFSTGSMSLPISVRDLRNLRLWGFNTIRLVVPPAKLGIRLENGKMTAHNEVFMASLERILNWADTYGIYVIIDVHKTSRGLSLPGTTDGFFGATSAMVPYLRHAFKLLATLGKTHPCVIGYEVLANEANIKDGLSYAFKKEMKDEFQDATQPRIRWNQWLKQRYGSLSALRQAWTTTANSPELNKLGDAENWDDLSIRNPVQLAIEHPELAHADNTRLYDWLLFLSEYYREQCEEVIKIVNAVDPGRLITFEENHELQFVPEVKEKYPTQGRWMCDLSPKGTDLSADHYDIVMAYKFPVFGKPWYAGENWITPSSAKDFAFILWRGGGNLGWAYGPTGHPHSRTIDRDRWLNDLWDVWAAVAPLYAMSDPAKDVKQADLLVLYSPIAPRTSYIGMTRALDAMDVNWDLASVRMFQENPRAFDRYKAIAVCLDRVDPECVKLLAADKRPVLYMGRQCVDMRQRWGTGFGPGKGLAGSFYRANSKAASAQPGSRGKTVGSSDTPTLSLAGKWSFRLDPEKQGDKANYQRLTAFPGWESIPVPGAWEDEGIGNHQGYNGVAWYATDFSVPKGLAGQDLAFSANAIDDVDEAWVNGVRIGVTDATVPYHWIAKRYYRIPAKILRPTGNHLVIRVEDIKGKGGIVSGPVTIEKYSRSGLSVTLKRPIGALAAGRKEMVAVAPEMPRVLPDDLCPGVDILATFDDGTVAAASRGDQILYLGGNGIALNSSVTFEQELFAQFLKNAGVAATVPMTAASRDLNVRPFTNFIVIENDSAKEQLVDAERYRNGREVAWHLLAAPPYLRRDGAPTQPVAVPAGSFLALVFTETDKEPQTNGIQNKQ